MTPEQEWDKKVRRLVTDPDGRAALQRIGIQLEVAGEDTSSKPTVVILCPTYRAPEPQMMDALRAMVRYTHEKEIGRAYSGPPIQSSVVHWSRNSLLTEHLKSGKPWTHALLIDDDIVPEPDDLQKLLAHGKDIVAGLCTRRQDPPIPNMRWLDENGEYRQIWDWKENALIADVAVGTGFMLVSQHAFEQVAQAYFDCLWEQDFYGLSGEKLEAMKIARVKMFDEGKLCSWFRFLPNLKVPEMGEDISFCHVAKKYCGITTYVDTSVQPGHVGNYPFSVRDFLPYKQALIQQAKAEGRFKERAESSQDQPKKSFRMTYKEEVMA